MKLIRNVRTERNDPGVVLVVFETGAGDFRLRCREGSADLAHGGQSLGEELSYEEALSRMLITLTNYQMSRLKVARAWDGSNGGPGVR